MSGKWGRNSVLQAFLVASTAIVPVGYARAQPQAASTQSALTFNIPAQPLSSALTAFARQSGIKLAYPASLAAGKSAPALQGSFASADALRALLVGSGLSYRFTGANAVTILDPSIAGTNQPPVNDGSLVLDTIEVTGRGSAPNADTPYETPGSVSHISQEQLDRVPPISAGDVFINTPGVISAGNRVGTSINPNIRGLQGMGRVNTTVDGARQTTSTYRGYIGNRDETYVDPDMIGGIDISKGPSAGVGTGAIGGNINFRTLEASDILREGKSYGTRLKGSVGTNTVAPPLRDTTVSAERPNGFNSDALSGSIAIAALQEHYEFVVAYSKRNFGNYFAGSKVGDGVRFGAGTANPQAQILPGKEVFNTSENTESFLAKGKSKWGDGHSLELGYLYYGSTHGEVNDLFLTTGFTNQQYDPTTTKVDTYTAKYRYEPSDNPYVNLRANLWLSDIRADRFLSTIEMPYGTRTVGGDIGNTSLFETPLGELTLDNGLEVVREHAEAEQFATTANNSGGWMTYGPSGVRLLTGVFTKASLKATNWLTMSAGARFDHFKSNGEGYLEKFPEQAGSRVSPNAGIVVTPFDGFQLFAQYTEGYRPPSLRESHWHFEGLLRNNPLLRPEIAKNSEAGLNILRQGVLVPNDKVRFKFSYFDNRYDDYIVRLRPPEWPTSTYRWDNIDHASFKGFEVSGGYDAGLLFVEGAYTKYDKIEYCSSAGGCGLPGATTSSTPLTNDYVANYIPPEYSGSLTVGTRLFDQKLTLGARTHFASTRAGTVWTQGSASRVGIDVTWPSYQVFDVFGSYKVHEDATIAFSIENITDRYYFGALSSVGLPSPGRTARLTFTTTLDHNQPFFPDFAFGRAAAGTPGSDWTGLYVGGHLGYAFSNINGVTTAADGTSNAVTQTESANINLADLARGGQIGFNYQFDNRVVIGIEGDVSWTKLYGVQEARATESATLAAAGWLQAKTTYQQDWIATLRGRAGYAFDRMFVYGTAGLAFLSEREVRSQYRSDIGSGALPFGRSTAEIFKENVTKTRQGWTAGAGFEYALMNNWSLKGEYAYAGFGAEELEFPGARSGVSLPFTERVRCRAGNTTPPCRGLNEFVTVASSEGSSTKVNGRNALNSLGLHTIKIGVNYRF